MYPSAKGVIAGDNTIQVLKRTADMRFGNAVLNDERYIDSLGLGHWAFGFRNWEKKLIFN